MFNKIFSITEEYRLSESYIIFTLLGIKLKFHRDSILGELLLPFKKSVYNCGKNNKIFVINRNGEKKLVKKIKQPRLILFDNYRVTGRFCVVIYL